MSQQPKQPRQSLEKQALQASLRNPRNLESTGKSKIQREESENPFKPSFRVNSRAAHDRMSGFLEKYRRNKPKQDVGGKKRKRRRTKKKRKRRRTKKRRKSRRRKRRKTRK